MINQDSTLSAKINANDFNEADPYIIRYPHDKQNPYLQVNRDFIRNADISLECRWFIIYLLSFKDNWRISIPWIMKDQNIGRRKMYAMLNEAIKEGYILRENYKVNNLKRTRYYVSEEGEFKKSFRYVHFEHAENVHAENSLEAPRDPPLPNGSSSLSPIPPILISPFPSSPKKEQFLCPKSAKASFSSSAEASDLYDHFLNEIRKRKPDFKEPSRAKWIADLDKILRIDKRSLPRAKELISWIMTDDFWSTVILSPQNLRKNFDKLEMKLEEWLKEKKKEPNKKLYYETRAKMPDRFKLLKVDKIGVTDTRSGRDAAWSLPEKTFAQVLASMIGGRAYED